MNYERTPSNDDRETFFSEQSLPNLAVKNRRSFKSLEEQHFQFLSTSFSLSTLIKTKLLHQKQQQRNPSA